MKNFLLYSLLICCVQSKSKLRGLQKNGNSTLKFQKDLPLVGMGPGMGDTWDTAINNSSVNYNVTMSPLDRSALKEVIVDKKKSQSNYHRVLRQSLKENWLDICTGPLQKETVVNATSVCKNVVVVTQILLHRVFHVAVTHLALDPQLRRVLCLTIMAITLKLEIVRIEVEN